MLQIRLQRKSSITVWLYVVNISRNTGSSRVVTMVTDLDEH